MKLPWEKKHVCWGITAFLAVSASVLFYMMLQRWDVVYMVLQLLGTSLAPITYGLILAYLMNPMLNWIEYALVLPVVKAMIKKNHKRVHSISRMVSIFISWSVTIAVTYALMALVMPEISASVGKLIEESPGYVSAIRGWGGDIIEKYPALGDLLQRVSDGASDPESLMKKFNEYIPSMDSMVASAYTLVATIFNIGVGVIVSVYVLNDKEKFTAQSKKTLYSVMSVEKANNFIAVMRMTHEKFGNFITGKIFDSLIIGLLCFVVMALFGMPYPVLISVIIGVTNVIPFFGPFIGAIPSALLVLLADPSKCIAFIIFVFLLQQFDGNILGPKILGSSTGISSFWVLFAILVGSGLFGFWGIICAVPFFAVTYTILREKCHASLRKKGVTTAPKLMRK